MQNTPIRNKREPFFNDVPPGVLAVGSLLVVIEILLQILGLEMYIQRDNTVFLTILVQESLI